MKNKDNHQTIKIKSPFCYISACPNLGLATILPDNINCEISPSCLAMHCCLDMDLANITKHVYKLSMTIDPCHHPTVTIDLDNWVHSRSLSGDFEFGKSMEVTVGNFMVIR